MRHHELARSTAPPTKASLSPKRWRLLELMQGINFGRIEGLHVRDGEPVFEPAPRVVRKVKIGAENGRRPELDAMDFVLKREVAELFEHLGRLGSGVVRTIEVKGGLPFALDIEETVRA